MIWCVEDDPAIRDIELYALQAAGFQAQGFEDTSPLREALKEQQPQLILLDVMLPGEDGLEFLQWLRSKPEYNRLPVIMATAKGSEYDKINGLDTGADDYLAKPFGMMEMVSRIKAVLRRCTPDLNPNYLQVGDLFMDLRSHSVTIKGQKTPLTLKEYEVLRVLMSAPNTVFDREKLFHLVWASDYIGESRTVDMHIRTLRQKLGTYGEMIQTVRGVGYLLENPNGS